MSTTLGGAFGVSSTIKVYVNGARKLTATNSLHSASTLYA